MCFSAWAARHWSCPQGEAEPPPTGTASCRCTNTGCGVPVAGNSLLLSHRDPVLAGTKVLRMLFKKGQHCAPRQACRLPTKDESVWGAARVIITTAAYLPHVCIIALTLTLPARSQDKARANYQLEHMTRVLYTNSNVRLRFALSQPRHACILCFAIAFVALQERGIWAMAGHWCMVCLCEWLWCRSRCMPCSCMPEALGLYSKYVRCGARHTRTLYLCQHPGLLAAFSMHADASCHWLLQKE